MSKKEKCPFLGEDYQCEHNNVKYLDSGKPVIDQLILCELCLLGKIAMR